MTKPALHQRKRLKQQIKQLRNKQKRHRRKLGLLLPFFATDKNDDNFFGYTGLNDELFVGNGSIFKWLDTLASTDDLAKIKYNIDNTIAYSLGDIESNDASYFHSLKLIVASVFGFYILILFIDAFRKISTAKVLMSIITIVGAIFLFSHVKERIHDVFRMECDPGAGVFIIIIASIVALAGCVYDYKKRKN